MKIKNIERVKELLKRRDVLRQLTKHFTQKGIRIINDVSIPEEWRIVFLKNFIEAEVFKIEKKLEEL